MTADPLDMLTSKYRHAMVMTFYTSNIVYHEFLPPRRDYTQTEVIHMVRLEFYDGRKWYTAERDYNPSQLDEVVRDMELHIVRRYEKSLEQT